MKNLGKLGAVALLLGLTGVAAEQSQPWTEWSAKDVEKILSDSFWSHTQTETDLNRPHAFTRRLTDAQVLSQSARINYRIRFLSARPVRQALYRLAKLNPKAAALDLKKLEAFIDADFSEAILVGVDFDSPEPRLVGPALLAFGSAVTSILAPNTYLEVPGKRVFLQDYRPPSPNGIGGAWFIFPRDVDGKPFIGDKSGDVRFHAEFPQKDSERAPVTLDWRFKISSFLYNGVLEF